MDPLSNPLRNRGWAILEIGVFESLKMGREEINLPHRRIPNNMCR